MSSGSKVSKSLILVNSLSSIALRLLSVTVLIWTQQYLLRRISAEEYALYPVLVSTMIFAPILTELLTGGVARYAVEAYSTGNQRRIVEIVSSMFPVLLLVTLIFLGLGGIFIGYLDRILTIDPKYLGDARLMMALMVFGSASRLLTIPFVLGFHVSQRFAALNLIHFAEGIFKIAILFTLLFEVSARVLWVVVATVTAGLGALVVQFVVSRSLVPSLKFRPSLFQWDTAKVLLSFGGWTAIGNLAHVIQQSAPAIILNKLGTSVDVATFHIGSIADRQIRMMTAIGLAPLQPALTTLHATQRSSSLRSAYLRGGRYYLWIILFAACPLGVFAPEIIDLYIGEAYLATSAVMMLLFCGYPLIYASAMLYRIAVATAQVRGFFSAAILNQLIIVLAILYAVGTLKMGAVGAAWAALVTSSVTQLLVFWPMGVRMVGSTLGSFIRETVWPGILPAIAGFLACAGLKMYARPETWPMLGVCVIAGSLPYAAVLLSFCLRPSDRKDLRRIGARLGALVPAKSAT